MNTNTPIEYRNLPLAVLTESATNPRRVFEDSALKELAEHPQSGRSLSLACAAPHRSELRDYRRSQTLSRRADGRSANGSGPHRQPYRRRGIGSAANAGSPDPSTACGRGDSR